MTDYPDDDEEETDDRFCHTCGGSGGGYPPFQCFSCGGSGMSLSHRQEEAEYRAEMLRDLAIDRKLEKEG